MPPLVNDPQPFYGSQFDTTTTDREPRSRDPLENYTNSNIAANLTFATLPLTFAGRRRRPQTMAKGSCARRPTWPIFGKDIPFMRRATAQPVNWRWYQEGYDHEPTEPPGPATHRRLCQPTTTVPQYFGYIANNPALTPHLRGLGDFFADLDGQQAAGAGRRVLHSRRLRQYRRA